MLVKMLDLGMDVARLKFYHVDHKVGPSRHANLYLYLDSPPDCLNY
jgi:hypothetical protein